MTIGFAHLAQPPLQRVTGTMSSPASVHQSITLSVYRVYYHVDVSALNQVSKRETLKIDCILTYRGPDMNQDFLSKYFPDQINKIKGRLFDTRTNRKMAWLHFTKLQRTTSIKSMLNEHDDSVLGNLKIHLAGTNEEEHIITSKGRRRLQSHPYYRQIVDHKDDTYWEVEANESDHYVEGQGGVDDTYWVVEVIESDARPTPPTFADPNDDSHPMALPLSDPQPAPAVLPRAQAAPPGLPQPVPAALVLPQPQPAPPALPQPQPAPSAPPQPPLMVRNV